MPPPKKEISAGAQRWRERERERQAALAEQAKQAAAAAVVAEKKPRARRTKTQIVLEAAEQWAAAEAAAEREREARMEQQQQEFTEAQKAEVAAQVTEFLKPSDLRKAREERADPMASELHAARTARDEPLIPRPLNPIPADVQAERTGFARGAPREPQLDAAQNVAWEKDRLRQEMWRQAILEEEARQKAQGGPPRVPMTATPQHFRVPDISEIPPNSDGSSPVKPGHAPKWVTLKNTASTEEHDSMAQVQAHQGWGYEFVKDDQGRPIVTGLGALMSAPFEAAARRELYYQPQGSMRSKNVSESLEALADETNRRAGKRIASVREMPDHGRHYSNTLRED